MKREIDEEIVRIEIINHADNFLEQGRLLVLLKKLNHFKNVELDYQDNGTTLKIFLS